MSTLEQFASMTAETRKCPECGEEREMYPAQKLCDACLAVWEARQAKTKAFDDWRYRVLNGIAVETLSEGFQKYRFGCSKPPSGENAEAWEKVKAADGNIYLYGPPGTGKTHLARCLLNRACYGGASIAEAQAPELVRIAASYDAGKSAITAAAKAADVFLLDDLDKISLWKNSATALWEILDARTRGKRRTIVTANLSPAALAKAFLKINVDNSSVIAAALNRLHPVTAIELTGKSLRGVVQ